MDKTSNELDRIADLQQRIHIALLPSLTENWMGVDYTMPQMKVLICLLVNGPYRMGALAATLGVSTATANGIINRLVRRGAVIRNHGPDDRRVVTCRLSPEGESQISALWTTRFGVYGDIFSTLSPEELDIVARAAELVLKAAKQKNVGIRVKPAETALIG